MTRGQEAEEKRKPKEKFRTDELSCGFNVQLKQEEGERVRLREHNNENERGRPAQRKDGELRKDEQEEEKTFRTK
ncbi:hypothetical protein Q5P01_015880 [Channa striata]|uniref:Uncharacterized protein n=1 Tax=Channa striata TaxID=64152 RepID=A0AA88MGV4_CHASR|nr:hypothetical protein Q5P01_015880 [Channa striata]